MIKLGDRLHNMRTIGSLRVDKRRRIGKETLEVYAPIASRLGMYAIKSELENLGFSACYPMRSRVLQATVDQLTHNSHILDRVVERIQASLSEKGVKATVTGREKHLYGLYKKMLNKQVTFERVFDMLAMRIIVDEERDCYRVLGIVHQLYPPIFSRFKDFIAVPKQNGYQSLHTVLKHGAENTPLEVQIRTVEMHATAESGIAAHWAYKNDPDNKALMSTPGWLSTLADLQQNSTDSVEYVESVKLDLFPGEIYVFSPKGKIIQLPTDATPVDFAYAVLSPMWLNSVVTAKARTAIRHYLRALDRSEAISFGERLLRRALKRHEITFNSEVAPVIVDSAKSPILYMAKCCRPIPGDSVRGFFTPGRGVAVHRSVCRNVRRYRRRPKEWVAVDWAADISDQFEVVLMCHLIHQPGALARVTNTMSVMNVNIEHMDFTNRSEDNVNIRFVLSVENRLQLARIVRRLRNLTVVRSVKRES